ncbi:ATP-dependent nuclease [Deinococcus soli (ex Cha et al. 2016)]|uniref:ATP-dependent nuclease n=1 Tax=Deinococcus soli (ex Cha et al. 2016) TaxID=1309411 RepID=UPI0012FECC86|nr:AAA family ATPase [Deinococcus soli (ex Cha et al. 2016)]
MHIRNYRSVKDLDIRFNLGRNIIVGRNNAGKTNIFKAIDMVMGERNPTYKNENFTQNDLYYWIDKETGEFYRSNEMFIWCELKKDSMEAIDFNSFDPKICMLPMYGSWVQNPDNGRREKRLNIMQLTDPVSAWKEISQIEESSSNKIWMTPNEEIYKNTINRSEKIVYIFYAFIDENGEMKKEMRMLVQGDAEGQYYLAFRAAIRNELINSAVLPSFRDPNSQLKLTSYSWFGKMIKSMVRDNPLVEDLDNAFSHANEIASQMFSGVKSEFEENMSYVFPESSLYFQLSVDKNDDVYKSLKIYVDDGYKSDLHDKGAGFQSSFVINMFKKYIDLTSGQKSAILCIEEPELFLHPHARRALSK